MLRWLLSSGSFPLTPPCLTPPEGFPHPALTMQWTPTLPGGSTSPFLSSLPTLPMAPVAGGLFTPGLQRTGTAQHGAPPWAPASRPSRGPHPALPGPHCDRSPPSPWPPGLSPTSPSSSLLGEDPSSGPRLPRSEAPSPAWPSKTHVSCPCPSLQPWPHWPLCTSHPALEFAVCTQALPSHPLPPGRPRRPDSPSS